MTRRIPKFLLPAEWPCLDRAAWDAARLPVGPLDRAGRAGARWSPATWRLTQEGYGTWLAWLAARNELDFEGSPESRVNHDRLRQYFQVLGDSGIADHTRASLVQALGDALRALAPEYDGRAISLAATRMRSLAQPSRDPGLRMRPAAEVLALGLELMRAAESGGLPRPKRPTYYRDGLLIAFLILCPLRIRSLTAIRLDQHLQRRGGDWRLELPSSAMKSGRPFECNWPEYLAPHLGRYLEIYLPALLAGQVTDANAQAALWVSSRGRIMDEAGIAQAIEVRTRREFGIHINPHSFRHIVATEIATHDPDNATDIAAILGHSSIEVSEKYYNHARAVRAARDYQALIIGRVGSEMRLR